MKKTTASVAPSSPIFSIFLIQMSVSRAFPPFFRNPVLSKLEGASGRFGDYLCMVGANLPGVSGHNQCVNTKFTRPITKISKSVVLRDGEVALLFVIRWSHSAARFPSRWNLFRLSKRPHCEIHQRQTNTQTPFSSPSFMLLPLLLPRNFTDQSNFSRASKDIPRPFCSCLIYRGDVFIHAQWHIHRRHSGMAPKADLKRDDGLLLMKFSICLHLIGNICADNQLTETAISVVWLSGDVIAKLSKGA